MSQREIERFLAENPPAGAFTPYTLFHQAADALTIYLEGSPDYSEQVDDVITVFRALNDNRVVGCRIDGISKLLKPIDRTQSEESQP